MHRAGAATGMARKGLCKDQGRGTTRQTACLTTDKGVSVFPCSPKELLTLILAKGYRYFTKLLNMMVTQNMCLTH